MAHGQRLLGLIQLQTDHKETHLVNSPKLFRPLLAATIENNEQLGALAYPMIASPKVDGIRIVVHPALGPVTRSLNRRVQ